ncbi:MAG: DUF3616 domain-containing protein [Sedimentisphaerales bacterium]|jgi:hypothetical protein|nr:DUF3616 domain-containing protein [Sedimentisphaerales bacterium]
MPLIFYILPAIISLGQVQPGILTFRGCADASAAVQIDHNLVAVAEDEDNVLRIYRIDGGMPVASFDMSGFLRVDPKFPEVDIEGAARIGNRIYWISSHGRNKDGKPRPSRYRFFATQIQDEAGRVQLRPVGRPYRQLLTRILAARQLKGLGLAEAAGVDLKTSKDRRLAPKDEGINIEGLSNCPGGQLYIGLRNPIPRHKALIIPLLNPDKVIEDGKDPEFGGPILLDLEGLGIRDLCFSAQTNSFYIIAGPSDETARSVLFRWTGQADDKPIKIMDLQLGIPDWTPEAMVMLEPGKILVLSDDGSRLVKVNGPQECRKGEYLPEGLCPNKALLDPGRKTFRGVILTIERNL